MADRLLLFRRIFLFALMIGTLMTTASLLFGIPRVVAATNLLTNPGFESGTTGWGVNFSTATFEVVATTVHAGSYAAALTSNSTSIKFISQTITSILPGSSYSFSGYGYVADANVQKIYLRLAWYSAADCSGSQLSTTDSNSITAIGSYQPLTATAKIAPASAACARIRASLDPVSSTTATAYFDDLSFTLDTASTPTFTPSPTRTPTPIPPAEKLLISEVLFDGTQVDEGDEFIEITNPLTKTVDLTGYKIGDEETKGSGEGMYAFPSGTNLAPNAVLVVAKNAGQLRARFGTNPAFELVASGSGLTDTLSVPNLAKYTAWASGSLALANSGDEVLLLGPSDELVDSVAWGNGNFAAVGVAGNADANDLQSLQRYGAQDTNNMTFDFLRAAPSPGTLVSPPALRTPLPGVAMPGGMYAYWGDLHAHSAASDGSGPPRMAFAKARAAGLHFFALTEHDSWLTTDEWNEIGSAAAAASADNAFIALRGFEFTSPDGHVTAFNTSTFVSHTDPNYDSLSKFYGWLSAQSNALAQFNHPVWDRGGDFDYLAFDAAGADRMALQEIGNNARSDYERFELMYIEALSHHWHVAPTNNSDNHDLTWGSDSRHRVGVLAPALTQANILDAFRARRVFATEDSHLALALQVNGVWMGSTIRAEPTLNFTVAVSDPEGEPMWIDLYDNGKIVRTQWFASSTTTWTQQVSGSSSHSYFVRVTQADGDVAYSAPIWTDDTPTEDRENPWNLGRVSIVTARTTRVGAQVDLEACVTVPPGIFGDRYLYIQDQTGGIKVYLPPQTGNFPQLRADDRVALRGRTAVEADERQVKIEDAGTIRTTGVCSPTTPKPNPTGLINPTIEGRLIEMNGIVKSVASGEFVLNDSSGDALVYIDANTKISQPRVAVGQRFRVIGVVSRAHGKSAVWLRFASDMAIAFAPAPTPTFTPRATATRRRTATPRASASPTTTTTRAPVVPSPTPRAFMRATPAPVQAAAIDAQALAVAGGATSIAASFMLFAVAAVMLRRR